MAASSRRSSNTTHKWTNFEKHTLLCLMAKGIHLEERSKRTDDHVALKQHAYLNLATALNDSVHKNSFENDINKREVSKMIDRMLLEKKGVVGKGGYMERSTRGRITRGLKKVWERDPPIDYDGSLGEWKIWINERETEKMRIRDGGAAQESGDVSESIEDGSGEDILALQSIPPTTKGDVWRQADVSAKSNRSNWHSSKNQSPLPATYQAEELNGTGIPARTNNWHHDSFQSLPTTLRSAEKFAWANPEAKYNRNFLLKGSDAYRSGPRSRHLRRGEDLSYDPTSDHSWTEGSSAGSSGLSPDISAVASSSHFCSYDPPNSRTAGCDPSLINGSSASSTMRSSSDTIFDLNPTNDNASAQTINSEIFQRHASEYKKPGILKHWKKSPVDKTVNGAIRAKLRWDIEDTEMAEMVNDSA